MRSVHVELLRQGLELHSSISGTDKTPRIRGYQFPALSQSRKKKIIKETGTTKKEKAHKLNEGSEVYLRRVLTISLVN